ncbi:unnamed protein product [Ambrosiozyma monospora]|uniref:Unnamed protein product n=1 Tax=Ambrosiozyma monospora TaxID=43982 RepID=A0A9W6YQW0_AMBMO|nr:unnamed protein product [Ambrosiozyma monospora]
MTETPASLPPAGPSVATTVATETISPSVERLNRKSGFNSFFNQSLNYFTDRVERGFITKNIFKIVLDENFNFRQKYKTYSIPAKENSVMRMYFMKMVSQKFFCTASSNENAMGILYELSSFCGYIKSSTTIFNELNDMFLSFHEPFQLKLELQAILLMCRLSSAPFLESSILEITVSRCPDMLSAFIESFYATKTADRKIDDFCSDLKVFYYRNPAVKARVTKALVGDSGARGNATPTVAIIDNVSENDNGSRDFDTTRGGRNANRSGRGGRGNRRGRGGRDSINFHPYQNKASDSVTKRRGQQCHNCGQYGHFQTDRVCPVFGLGFEEKMKVINKLQRHENHHQIGKIEFDENHHQIGKIEFGDYEKNY